MNYETPLAIFVLLLMLVFVAGWFIGTLNADTYKEKQSQWMEQYTRIKETIYTSPVTEPNYELINGLLSEIYKLELSSEPKNQDSLYKLTIKFYNKFKHETVEA